MNLADDLTARIRQIAERAQHRPRAVAVPPCHGLSCQLATTAGVVPGGPRLPAGDAPEGRDREEDQPAQAAPHLQDYPTMGCAFYFSL
jgi:hypothetical protein